MMKVVPNPTLLEKCDSTNINDFDITYMNKLNEKLNANGDLTFNQTKIQKNVSVNGNCEAVDVPAKNKSGSEADVLSIGCAVSGEDLKKSRAATDDEASSAYGSSNELCGESGEKLVINENENLSNSDSGLESATSSWDKSVTEIKEHAYIKLEEELQHAREILKLRDEEVSRLRKMRQDGDNELLELTASLFEEAHSMVNDANVKRAAAEKAVKESLMKVEVLTAEVTALKTLVLTSTPSKPNLHLHNQAHSKTKEDSSFLSNGGTFFKKHHRSPSHFDLKYGRETSPTQKSLEDINQVAEVEPSLEYRQGYELDPNFHREFLRWKENPTLEKDNPFITHMYNEDIDQCLDFSNSTLVAEMKKAIDSENIFIEAVDKAKAVFPKKCALMEVPRLCYYRMKITDADEWLDISQMCRNRIIAVCNFLNYLRYIQRGLVKSSADDMFWEVVRLRKEMMLAKLGLPIPSLSS